METFRQTVVRGTGLLGGRVFGGVAEMLRSLMCVMEMFDKATFAQVPLEVTGDPAHPVRVRSDANGAYKVGVSPLWRLGKKMLGITCRCASAPASRSHAGRGWQLMDVGLRGMSGVLAD